MSDTWDDEDRAIARALDAIESPDEHTEPGAADEYLVDEYRDVLGHMPIPEAAPRPELEDQVVAAALARRPAAAPGLEQARARRARRPRRLQVAALAIATLAAAVVIGVIVRTGPSETAPTAHVSLATVQRDDIDALLRAPGSRTGVLAKFGRVVVAPDGNGAVYDTTTKDPFSIGLVSKAGTTTIGPAQPTGGVIAFVVDHPERVTSVELWRNGVVVASTGLAAR